MSQEKRIYVSVLRFAGIPVSGMTGRKTSIRETSI